MVNVLLIMKTVHLILILLALISQDHQQFVQNFLQDLNLHFLRISVAISQYRKLAIMALIVHFNVHLIKRIANVANLGL
jgi:hypothetical protein